MYIKCFVYVKYCEKDKPIIKRDPFFYLTFEHDLKTSTTTLTGRESFTSFKARRLISYAYIKISYSYNGFSSINNSIAIFDVSCAEVINVIHYLNNSSAGYDEFPTFVAKLCVESFIQPLTFLINSSLKSGVFPSELKLARVVPIFKAGNSSNLTNYRPISVLTFFAKVFEKIVYNKVMDFISENNVLNDHQYGFRKGRSTQQAIITLVDRITKSQDIGDIVIAL